MARPLEPDPKAYARLIIDNHRPLSNPTTAAQTWRREPLFMPLKRPWWRTRSRPSLGGKRTYSVAETAYVLLIVFSG
jgi:hypothetical protein